MNKHIKLDDEEHFEKVVNENTTAYRPKNYSGLKAINCIPSKKCGEYYKNAVVQINLSLKQDDC